MAAKNNALFWGLFAVVALVAGAVSGQVFPLVYGCACAIAAALHWWRYRRQRDQQP